MARKWEGRSKTTVLGYKIILGCIRYLGVGTAYFVLRFVAFWFLLFSREGTKASYYYFKNRWGYSSLRSLLKCYRHNYIFGQILIDKMAIASGLRERYTYEFDGIERIKAMLAEKRGGILLSAHVGNFEVADFFFRDIDLNAQINIVVLDNEHRGIKEYLESVMGKTNLRSILVKEDMSHIFEIHQALDRNELICLSGDRYLEGTKTTEAELLGATAKFPAGVFAVAARLNVPVLFVYVMKETARHYHLYARTAEVKRRDTQGLLQQYTQSIESVLHRYPYQWFNFFDFWDEYDSKNESGKNP